MSLIRGERYKRLGLLQKNGQPLSGSLAESVRLNPFPFLKRNKIGMASMGELAFFEVG